VDVLILQNCKTMEALCFGRKNSKSIDEQEQEFVKLKTDKGVKAFEKLRLLYLRNNNPKVMEYYVHLCSKELTWLCLKGSIIGFQSLEKLGSFTGLRVLELNSCDELIELPSSIGNLSLLTELQLGSCKDLKTLPDTISKLQKLQILELQDCSSLESLPPSIDNLSLLIKLQLG
jgi:Leucine-rich repeat (LRR) protein